MTQPLIDADILVYEIAATGQYIDEDGETRLRPWDWVEETIDFRIKSICEAVEATEKPILYLTGDEYLWKVKARVRPSLPSYEPNFRIERAKLRTYKGTRKVDKPFYYNSIRAYLVVVYDAFVSIGCEADDEMAMEQTRRPSETIICTRDKDLRQVAGKHYGWESGLQAEFGPSSYDELGTIKLIRGKSSTKIVGGGFKFFASQLLTGDIVDNIIGLPKYGPVKVASLLGDSKSIRDLLSRVQQEYQIVYPEDWKTQLREQCDLLWMIRERNEDGSLKFFNPKEFMNG
jgi:hypothetical protein